jgi:hypothetical protein
MPRFASELELEETLLSVAFGVAGLMIFGAIRFKLAIHRESRVMTALALVLDKNGLRIKPVQAGRGVQHGDPPWSQRLYDAISGSIIERHGSPRERPNGTPGIYDIDLKWMPVCGRSGQRRPPTGRAPATSVFSAAQEIGLKLRSCLLS